MIVHHSAGGSDKFTARITNPDGSAAEVIVSLLEPTGSETVDHDVAATIGHMFEHRLGADGLFYWTVMNELPEGVWLTHDGWLVGVPQVECDRLLYVECRMVNGPTRVHVVRLLVEPEVPEDRAIIPLTASEVGEFAKRELTAHRMAESV